MSILHQDVNKNLLKMLDKTQMLDWMLTNRKSYHQGNPKDIITSNMPSITMIDDIIVEVEQDEDELEQNDGW